MKTVYNITLLKEEKEKQWLKDFLTQSWGGSIIVSRGRVHRVEELPVLIARTTLNEPCGLLAYEIKGKECEIVVLESFIKNQGVGTQLLEEVKKIAKDFLCERIWLITTNDNLNALKFYQKRGYRLVAVYPEAVNEARKLKPQIPHIGYDGIPIRDEIELELKL